MLRKDEELMPKVKTIVNKNNSLSSMPLEDLSPLINIEDLKKDLILKVKKISYLARKKPSYR